MYLCCAKLKSQRGDWISILTGIVSVGRVTAGRREAISDLGVAVRGADGAVAEILDAAVLFGGKGAGLVVQGIAG